jgi:hypothetical protein
LTVTGLANQQTVLIEEFRDANGNGAIDAGEPLLLSFKVSDGQVALFAPPPGRGSPGDDDNATNGQVRKVLTLSILPESVRAVGSYVFKVSALDGSFVPVVQPFVILPGAYPQAVEGRVLDGGTPVASAMVALLAVSGDDAALVTAIWTDGTGHFSLPAPPDDYLVLALKPGYVGSVGAGPMVSLASGLSRTQDVVLLPASSSISGRVTDALTSNGIPGLNCSWIHRMASWP